jgi:mRNA-degrading endonuclease RelE of RelBE toxin-antitoxin system
MPNSTPYRIRIAATADRELRRLPGNVRQRARRAIQELAEEARPGDAKELREQSRYGACSSFLRIPSGSLRIRFSNSSSNAWSAR